MSFKIVNRRVLSEDLKRLDIEARAIALKVRAGQFVRLCLHEGGRHIPLPVAEADASRGIISFIVQQTDSVTKRLGEMGVGEAVYSILGPLGVPAPTGKKGTVFCIATGTGIAQILPICRALRKEGNKVIGIIGARTKKALLLESQMRLACSKIFVTTEDGSYERRGLATDLFAKLLPEHDAQGVYAAGSTQMMESVCALTKEAAVKTYVVVNPVMVDCTGMCGSCRVRVDQKEVFACVEGPVFDGHRIDFEDLRRHREDPKTAVSRPSKGVRNFQEVSRGISKKISVEEARRCTQCPDPVCVKGCPLGINIPAFIRALREGNAAKALEKIREESCFPSVCGRICSAPCETVCVLNEEHNTPIRVRLLERYAADSGRPKFMRRKPPAPAVSAKKVAIVGSGPAGLTAAAVLAAKGFRVTVVESFDQPGGVLRYGIPEFRLPKKILDMEIGEIRSLGAQIQTDCYVGKTAGLEDFLNEGFAAVLLATGRGLPRIKDIPGIQWAGVCYSDEFLMRVNLTKDAGASEFSIGAKTAVIGSGNIALDCARAAVRLGSAAVVVADSPIPDKPVFKEDLERGRAEGVLWEAPVKSLEILSHQDKSVRGVQCVRLDYAQGACEGKWELTPVPDSEFIVEADRVIVAAGHRPNTLLCRDLPGLKVNADGSFWVDEYSGRTSLENVFAAVSGGSMVDAIAAGKKAAAHIVQYLTVAAKK